MGVHAGGDCVVQIDSEVFLGEFDGVALVHVALEGCDEALHVLDFHAIDFTDAEVAQAFVADGGRGGNGTAEENDAVHFLLIFFWVFHGI